MTAMGRHYRPTEAETRPLLPAEALGQLADQRAYCRHGFITAPGALDDAHHGASDDDAVDQHVHCLPLAPDVSDDSAHVEPPPFALERFEFVIDDIPASGLIAEGSRVSYAPLVAGSPESVEEFNEAIAGKLSDDVRLRSAEESSERAYAAADRAQRFLSLTAIPALT